MTPHDRRRVAVESRMSERTVYRWWIDQNSVNESSRARIIEAIKKLKIKVNHA